MTENRTWGYVFCSLLSTIVIVTFFMTSAINIDDYELVAATTTSESLMTSDTFSANGTISSLVITVPQSGFNITNAFKVILTGVWNLSADKGNLTDFAVNFLASPMDGAKGHTHQITNFKHSSNDNAKAVDLTESKSLSMKGTADFKINGKLIWKDVKISILISNGNIISIDPDDKDTGYHFGNQPIYGIVNSLI